VPELMKLALAPSSANIVTLPLPSLRLATDSEALPAARHNSEQGLLA